MWRRLAISLALVCTVRGARASEDYPDVIRATVSTKQALPCTLCHALGDGGDAAVVTDFGRALQDFGMKGSDPASLQRALRRDAARGWDTDGDGIPDIEELVFGSDPSGPALSSGPPLMHGCSIGYVASPWRWALFLFAPIAWALWKRRSVHR